MHSTIENLLTKDIIKQYGNSEIVGQFLNDFKTQTKLYYPMACEDFSDILYINGKRISELNECSPTIFIHSHVNLTLTGGFNYNCLEPSVRFVTYFTLFKEEGKAITLAKFIKPDINYHYWLLNFGGYFNDEVLKFVVKNNYKISLIYSNDESMYLWDTPSIFYPVLYEILGVKYHITTHSIEFINSYIYSIGLHDLVQNLNNILKIADNPFIAELLLKNEQDLRDQLAAYFINYTNYTESNINTETVLRIYHSYYRLDEFKLRVTV